MARSASGLPASEKPSEGAEKHQSTKAQKHQKGGGNNTATQSIQKGKAAAKKKPANVPLTSRKDQSEKQVVNSALADQLAKLKGNIALAPEKPPKKSKRGKPNKRQKPAPIRQKPISENKEKPRLTLSGAPKSDTEVVSEVPQDHHPKPRVKVSVRNGRLADGCTLSEKSQPRLSSTSWDKRKQGGSSRNFRYDDTPDDSQRQPGNPAIVEQYRQEEDAGRYMGHSFREKGGEYGSLPLYDDHDERDDY